MPVSTETLEDFYRQKLDAMPKGFSWDGAHFNIFRMDGLIGRRGPTKFTRKDFYKVAIVKGCSRFDYGDERFDIDGDALIFFNPSVPYTWHPVEGGSGMFCIFNDAFFTDTLRSSLRDLPMFLPGTRPVFLLQADQSTEIDQIFEKMLSALQSDYRLKYDLIRNYIVETLHFALRMQPSASYSQQHNANTRITLQFMDLLQRQFPIESPQQQFALRSPAEVADRMAIHVNHLNRALRETTGKTTSSLIADRLITEAKALLKHTAWPVSEISYSLGFEDMAHFDNFFKKQSGLTPSSFRAIDGIMS